MQVEWSKEWPKEPGFYWFYGFRFQNSKDPELQLARFFASGPDGRQLVGVDRSGFIYDSELGLRRWAKAETPELPDLEAN